jgi:hypothetical protein
MKDTIEVQMITVDSKKVSADYPELKGFPIRIDGIRFGYGKIAIERCGTVAFRYSNWRGL